MKKFRVGRKQQRAILDEKGLEVALFHESQIELAKLTCKLLNNHYKNKGKTVNEILDAKMEERIKSLKGE